MVDQQDIGGSPAHHDAAAIWQADLPWHPGEDPTERLTAGFVEFDGEPNFVLTVSRPGQLHRDRAWTACRIPVSEFFDRKVYPGRRLNVKATHEGAAAMSVPLEGNAVLLAQHRTVASGVHVLRLEAHDGRQDRLVLVVTWFVSKGNAHGQTVVDMTRDECETATMNPAFRP